jgi:hypothetical protein
MQVLARINREKRGGWWWKGRKRLLLGRYVGVGD